MKTPAPTGAPRKETNPMLTYTNILESLTTAANGEISDQVLEAAATEIWENNSFETYADFDAYPHTWEIVARHDALTNA